MANSLVSNITVPNAAGTAYETYDLKDAWARETIVNDILPVLEGGMHYVGVTTSAVTDGSTTNPVNIVGKTDPVTVTSGDIVTKGNAEFVWDGSAWREFGDMSALGDFAYVDVGHTTVTPHGTVSKPTFSGSSSSVSFTITETDSGSNYQPKGTVSKPTFTGSASTVDLTATKVTSGDDYTVQLSGTVSKPTFTGTAAATTITATKVTSGSDFNFQPTGTISQPTFSDGAVTASGTITVLKSVAVSTNATSNKTATVSPASSGTVTYTPAGTVTGGAVTVGSKSISIIDGVGSVATLKGAYTSSTENLKLNFSGGSVPTKKSVTVGSEGAATVGEYTFAGTGVRLVTGNIPVPSSYTVTPTTEDKTVSVTGTATGTVSTPTFTGDKWKFTGSTTATGSVSQPTFTGDKYKFTGSTTASGSVSQPTFTGTKVKFAGSTTASGSVSQPTFTGTAETWTVNPGPST